MDVDTSTTVGPNKATKTFVLSREYIPIAIILVLVLVVIFVYWCKDSTGFTNSSLVTRSDSVIDKEWNLRKLEESVASLNNKANN